MFIAMAGWRGVATHLLRLSDEEARQEAAVILQTLQKELRSPELVDPGPGFDAARWMADPIGLQRIYEGLRGG